MFSPTGLTPANSSCTTSWPITATRLVLGHIFGGERGAFGDVVAVGRQIRGRGAHERRRFEARAAVDQFYAGGVDDGGGAFDVRSEAWVLERLRVGLGQRDARRGAARPRAAAKAATTGLYDQHVGAQALDARLDSFGGAVADGDQHDHRGDPDRHAEDRQPRTELVGGDPAPRDAQRLGTDHGWAVPIMAGSPQRRRRRPGGGVPTSDDGPRVGRRARLPGGDPRRLRRR